MLIRTDPERIRTSGPIVFRVPPIFYSRLQEAQLSYILASLHRRVPRRTLYLLTYDRKAGVHVLGRIGRSALKRQNDPELMASCRQVELASIPATAQEYCWIRPVGNEHYISPSGRHCSAFLRVSDAIRSIEALDTIAFWLLPEIQSADAILVDSWSIASVVLRGLQLLGKKIPFDCLSGHPRYERTAAAAAIEQLIGALRPNPRLCCVVSLSSSETFIDFVRRTVDAMNKPVRLFIRSVFAFLTATHSDALCTLPDSVESYPAEGDCALCGKGSPSVPIDPRLYYPRHRPESEHALTPDYFEDGKRTCVQFANISGALRVHRDDLTAGTSRHNALDIDVAQLLADPGVVQKCVEVWQTANLNNPVVITPGHSAGRLLAALSTTAVSPLGVIHNDLDGMTPLVSSEQQLLSSATEVLVLDDALVSGSRLETYKRNLRLYSHLSKICYFVVVARPESPQGLKEIKNSLKRHASCDCSLIYAYRLHLPLWSAKECPWCAEYQLLSFVSEQMAQPPDWLTKRVSRLAERESGLLAEPLLLLPGVADRPIAAHSTIAPQGTSAMGVLYAFASALQMMRNDPEEKERLGMHPAYSTVLALRTIERNYDEGLLQAILLRMVKRNEWGERNRVKLQACLAEAIRHPDRHILLGELLLATVRDSVPRFGKESFDEIFGSYLGEHCEAVRSSIDRL